MFVFILPILQVIAACFTIFGFMHTPNVANTVVTYGVSGEQAPNAAMWFNSVGSIAIGAGTWVASLILKNKLGIGGLLYQTVMELIKRPNDIFANMKMILGSIDLAEKHLATPGDAADAEALAYMRNWVTTKFVAKMAQQQLTPPTK